MINPSGYALGFIIYHTKHERVFVSYKPLMQNYPLIYSTQTLSWLMYKPSPCGLVFILLGFIIYHTKHERVYVYYICIESMRFINEKGLLSVPWRAVSNVINIKVNYLYSFLLISNCTSDCEINIGIVYKWLHLPRAPILNSLLLSKNMLVH